MEAILTDLEAKLASTAGEDLRQILCEQLATAETRLRVLALAGMTPEAFQRAQTCLTALTTAMDLLNTLVVPADTSVPHPLSPLLSPLLSPSLSPIPHSAIQASFHADVHLAASPYSLR